MPILSPNPNVGTGGAPVATPPMMGQYPGGNRLLQEYWAARRAHPWLFPQDGLLNKVPDVHPEGVPRLPQRGLLEKIADIYNFPKKGLMGTLATEGAGGRGLGPRGGGGLLGSRWRDPRSIQQYEVEQGLPPGSIKMPSAPVTNISPTATKPVEISPELMIRRLQQSGPTPAQMARPVKQTPEISAKLQAARDQRAAHAKIRETTEKHRSNMSPELWLRMSPANRAQWLKDADWRAWPTEVQRSFIERYMPHGIGGPDK